MFHESPVEKLILVQYLFLYLSIYSLIYVFLHLFINIFTSLFIYLFFYSSLHPFLLLLRYSCVFIYSFPSVSPFVGSLIHLSFSLFTHFTNHLSLPIIAFLRLLNFLNYSFSAPVSLSTNIYLAFSPIYDFLVRFFSYLLFILFASLLFIHFFSHFPLHFPFAISLILPFPYLLISSPILSFIYSYFNSYLLFTYFLIHPPSSSSFIFLSYFFIRFFINLSSCSFISSLIFLSTSLPIRNFIRFSLFLFRRFSSYLLTS